MKPSDALALSVYVETFTTTLEGTTYELPDTSDARAFVAAVARVLPVREGQPAVSPPVLPVEPS